MSIPASWLNPEIDWQSCHQALQQRGRLQIRNFLVPELARRFQYCLQHEVPWDLAYRHAEQNKLIKADAWRNLPAAERAALHQKVCQEAQHGFQFWYFTYMMVAAYIEQRAPGHFLNTVVEWLNGPEFLEIGRMLSGASDIRKADGQATCYIPGCFLTSHDDSGAPQGQIRRMAYVMSFTEGWRAGWGGLLHFTDLGGNVVDTLMPEFNTLNVFLTPQPHEVSFVAPFASEPRLSLTGWFRAD